MPEAKPARSGSHLVAAGILLSRVMGLVRQKIFAHYFGNSDAGDAFYAALKIPNFPQNLLGDGVLSASFIPIYSSMRARGESEEADRVAGAVGSILAIVNTAIVAAGVFAAPVLIDIIAPGFHGEKRELTIRLVQIFFPGTGLLVMSAWCLGILNSHRRFFLSYAAPVFWNLTIIAALFIFGSHVGLHEAQTPLAIHTAWGVLIGSAIQFMIQIPTVLKCAPALRWGLKSKPGPLREIFKNVAPVVMARGAVQVSAYVDNVLASLLPGGAVSSLAYAQSLYLLPISLFGMSVSAAELPAMSSLQGTSDEIATLLQKRMGSALMQISFFIVPSVVGFLFLGDVIVGGIYQGGAFSRDTTLYVWGVLAGSTVGLLATTQARLYSSAFYSLKDTKTPLRFALIRVFLTITLGYFFGLILPGLLGYSTSWGTAGLTASAGMSGWVEFLLLRRSFKLRVGKEIHLSKIFLIKLWAAALLSAALAWGIKLGIGLKHPMLAIPVILLPYGVAYFALTAALGLEQPRSVIRRLIRR
jgi:putative peptidoglycan lipid II flippase